MVRIDRRTAVSLAALGVLGLAGCSAPAPTPAPTRRAAPARVVTSPTPTPTPTPTFDTTQHSLTDPNSLWVVVNKRRPLPDGYVPVVHGVPVPHTNPPLLRKASGAAVVALFAGARRDGIELASNSTYRSFLDQRSTYEDDRANLGRKKADGLTAHPGCSEHQTGLAIDIGPLSGRCSLDDCMGDLPEGRWLAEHAWRYGFLLRYPAAKVAITGYQYEPWHFRYLGKGLAAELHRTGVATLEEFFGLPAAPGYL